MENDGLMVDGALMLYGVIGFDDEEGFTAAQVRRALASVGGADITVRVNSPGGVVMEGAAILAALQQHPGKVTAVIEGVAASAASLLVMGADTIQIAPAAMMMIHDPSMITIGTAQDHRQSATALEAMAGTYAAAYAARSGQSVETVRQMMRDETWMTADEAVALGFGDEVLEPARDAEPVAFAWHEFKNAPDGLARRAQKEDWPGWAVHNRATAPKSQEADMSSDTKKAAPAATEPAEATMQATEAPAVKPEPQPTMKSDPAAQAAQMREDARRAVVQRFGAKMTAADVEAIVADCRDPADALMRAAEKAVEAMMQGAGPETRESIRVTDDEDERRAEAIIGALGSTMFGKPLEGAAHDYRGLTMRSLAMELAPQKGLRFTDIERVKAGMSARGALMKGAAHSTSDFTYITGEVMNRALRDAYASRPGTWRSISRGRTATDFRTLYSVQAGVDVEMRKVLENGEYQQTVLSDEAESLRVERYGRSVLLTFEAVINDDLGAFARLPQDFARGALNLESRVAWAIINANANLSDGVALFATAATRKNLASSGGVISATTVGAGRKAMWEQRPKGAKASGDDFISAVPDLLVVPPALELAALQFVTATIPDQDGNTNPFKASLRPLVEPRLGAAVTGGSNTAWYLFDSSLPVLEHAFLQGYEAPMVQAMDETDPRGVKMVAEHIFGAAAVEFRGSYKNPGA